MKINSKNLSIISLAALGITAVSGAVSYITAKYLIDVAVDRDLPEKAKGREGAFAGTVSSKEEFEASKYASERLASTKTELVRITAKDGTRLVGHFYHHPSPKRIIIAMHGWRSSWNRDFGFVSRFWKENGCSILFAEQRGQNSSGGKHMSFGLAERYDCLEWVKYVVGRCGSTLPVYLAGISMGATTVLMAAGSELPSCVKGVIADCGFTSPREIWKHVVNKNLKMTYGLRGIIADEMFRKKLKMRSSEYSTVKAMEHCKTPIFFIHGGKDKFVPINMTYKNYNACAAPKRLLIVPNAGHGMSYYHDKENYERETKEFWAEFD